MNKKMILGFSILIFCYFILSNNSIVLSDPALNQSNVSAGGGNVTPLNIDAQQETTIWQGYFGTVNGGVVLEDSEGATLYDWTILDAQGEVYATRNLITDWSAINCTNQTQIYNEENLLNIPNSSSQSINNTFTNTTHPGFIVGGKTVSGCRSTRTDNTTTKQSVFWNVLLSSNSTNVVYTGIMDDNVVGFNGTEVDYQLLVPTDFSTSQALYFIYLEFS